MRKELLKGLSKEQIAKAKACKNQEEILMLAKTEGIELTDEQLELVNGGFLVKQQNHVQNVVLKALKKNIAEMMFICTLSSFVRNVDVNGIQINLRNNQFNHYEDKRLALASFF